MVIALFGSRPAASRSPDHPFVGRTHLMIVENNPGNGGNVFLAVILGAVLVAVGIGGFFMWDSYKSGAGSAVPTKIVVVHH